MEKTALLLVDLQNDFMPGGALAVPRGNEIISLANKLQAYFDTVIASQDWHPENHQSFADNHPGHKLYDKIKLDNLEQILWPRHCVQHTKGAALIDTLNTHKISKIIHKGTNPAIDSYSVFFDNAHRQKTSLDDYLKSEAISTIYLLGLATDYCVKYSVLDGCKLGYKVFVIEDACRGINVEPDDVSLALQEMVNSGAKVVKSAEIFAKS